MAIGKRIRTLRVARGLSQTKLAKAIGITQGALSQIEIGSVLSLRADTLLHLATVLDANPTWIATGRGSPSAATVQDIDESEAISVFRALRPSHRAAWLATGRALLDSQDEPSASTPYPRAKLQGRVKP